MLQKAPHIIGLSSVKVQEQLDKKEIFYFPLRSNRSYWQILRSNVLSLYNIILIISVTLILLLKGSKDVLVAVALVFFNISIGLFQEVRAKRALDRLATLNTQNVHVRRNSISTSIPLTELVKGDVIEIFPGEPIVADGKILFSDSLELDESSLTGESESVAKESGHLVTSGAFCLAGYGLMLAEKIGKTSSLYELTQKAKEFRNSQTDSEKWLKRLFQILLLTILLLAPLTLISGINQNLPLSQALINVVNLVSSLVPQGMILSMTILFAYGSIAISKHHTLVQRNNAIAIMGTITVLCADKTGTLTTNQLELVKIVSLNNFNATKIKEKLKLFSEQVSWANKTIQAIATFLSETTKAKTSRKTAEVPFTSEQKWGSISFDHTTLILGAPDILTSDRQILEQVSQLANKGFRVLLLAETESTVSDGKKIPKNLTCAALLAFQDTLRTDVREACENLAKQHIKLKIISGDGIETLQSIAGQLKLPHTHVYDQHMLESMDSGTLSDAIRQGQFFARISPSMKETIIAVLTKQGEIVAMIGDGVNDVKALKMAHVSIAMNDAAQVTKDVADIILLDNSFSTLPQAISEGQDITQRVYAVAKIFFIKVVYLTTLFLIAGFASFAFPISIRQTTWLGFIVVGVPTALIAFKVLTPVIIKYPKDGLLRFTVVTGIVGGLIMAFIMIFTQLILGGDLESSRTQVSLFASLYSSFILFQIHGINILSLSSLKKNWSSLVIILLIGFIAIIFPSALAPRAFQSAHLDYSDWLVIAFSIAGSIFILRTLLNQIHLIKPFLQRLIAA